MSLNISINPNKTIKNTDKNVSFKGDCVSSFMNLAANNDAFNAAFVDIFGMVLPRTYVDSRRNEHAKEETLRREIMGTITHCFLAGIVALGIGLAAKPFLKIKTNLYANDDTIDLLKKAWDDAGGETEKYVKNVFNGIKGLDNCTWNSYPGTLDAQILKDHGNPVERMVKLINKEGNLSRKEELKNIEDAIGLAIKSRKTIQVQVGEGAEAKKLNTSLGFLLRDMHDMGEHVFTRYANNTNGETIDSAIKKLKKLNNVKAVGALGIVCFVNLIVQHFNRKLTEKETGQKGFVGYNDYGQTKTDSSDKNKKRNLLIQKGIALLALAVCAKKTINFKEGLKKFQFQKLTPTMDQVMLLFSATVAGRVLSSEDGNELRETCTRDFFAFFNWIILGNVVAKAIIWKYDRGLINSKVNVSEQKYKNKSKFERFNIWIQDMSIKTHDEVRDKYKYASKSDLNKHISTLNKAIGTGLLYSTVALGVGIPILNMYLTNKKRAKELAAQKQTNISPTSQPVSVKVHNANNDIFAAFNQV